MIINPRFDYATVDRVTHEDGTRFYTCPETGDWLPSVTTVLSATDDRTALILWEKAVGKAKADRVREEACNLGTLMHTNLENHIQGIPQLKGNHPLRMQARRMADVVITNGFPKIDEVWGFEKAMYWPGLFGGMCDLMGIHEAEETIMDHKTSKKIKKAEDIEAYFCQVSAYAKSHNLIHGTNIRKAVIFMVSRDLQYAEFVLDGPMIEKYWNIFLNRLETFLKQA